MADLQEKPTLGDLQRYVAEVCQERGWTKDTPAEKFVLFVEEVGELAKETRKAAGLYVEHAKPQQMSLEEEFGLEISDEDAEKIATVGDAASYIEEHQN